MELYDIDALASILKNDLDAVVVTTDGFRRGDIARKWALRWPPRFRRGRWWNTFRWRIFDRILLLSDPIPPDKKVYYDELTSK